MWRRSHYHCLKPWCTYAVFIVISMALCGGSGVLSLWKTLTDSARLHDDHLPLYQRALRLKWQNYKVLELATRTIERHDVFLSLYSATMADMNTELAWMLAKVEEIGEETWRSTLQEVHSLQTERIMDDQLAVDGAECTQWGTFDCTIPVPGVASNVDITVTLGDGKAACDVVASSAGHICEWVPERPDEVVEPQPPNLLNKCVCYACKGPLPTAEQVANSSFSFPDSYRSSRRGTAGKYQCLNDPRYKDVCHWDGLNCIPDIPKPDKTVLNTTHYMDRFDSIASLLTRTQAEIFERIQDDINALILLADMSVVATSSTALLFTLIVVGWASWQAWRPGKKYSLGLAFYTMVALFVFLAWSCFGFLTFTGTHINDQCTTLLDEELVIHQVAWNIMHYDATLTTSASRFVMTAHNTGWIDEEYVGTPGGVRVYDYWYINYIETVGHLDHAINFAVSNAFHAEERQIFSTIDTVNKMLVDLEQIALCSCEPPDASVPPANDTSLGVSALYSSTYLGAKETYNQQAKNFLNLHVQRLLARVSEIESKAELMLIMAVTIVIFTTISLIEILRQIMSRKDQREEEYEQRRKQIRHVLSNTVDLFAHPLITIRADIFMRLGRMVQHEEARRKGVLTYSSSPPEAKQVWILFISHQWLGVGHPDPAGVQYAATCQAIQEVASIHNLKPSGIHVWLDYHSIPQLNGVSVGVGMSAVASLVNYAMHSAAMCVVAPHAEHTRGYTCNHSTYIARGWCRAEQAGYMLKNGTTNLYILDETGFRTPPPESMADYEAFFPMEGRFTCCDMCHPDGGMCDREKLVNVMIYLYYAAKKLQSSKEHSFVHDFVMMNTKRIFPHSFQKSTGKSSTVQKELFGCLLHDLDNMIASGEVRLRPTKPRQWFLDL